MGHYIPRIRYIVLSAECLLGYKLKNNIYLPACRLWAGGELTLEGIIMKKHKVEHFEEHFIGHNTTHVCEIEEPHEPHVRGQYHTVCYGWLENFCTGKSGIVSDGRRLVIKRDVRSGNAHHPGSAVVRYFYEEEENEEDEN
jgi:hypothetical protein